MHSASNVDNIKRYNTHVEFINNNITRKHKKFIVDPLLNSLAGVFYLPIGTSTYYDF